jgi:hypothetical protein
MKNRRFRHRLFFPAGLLSLAVLPIVFVLLLNQRDAMTRKQTLEVNLLPYEVPEPFTKRRPSGLSEVDNWFESNEPSRPIRRVIRLTTNDLSSRNPWMIVGSHVSGLVNTKDTVTCLVVVLERDAKYSDFVELNDQLTIHSSRNYDIAFRIQNGMFYVAYRKDRDLSATSTCASVFLPPKKGRTFLGNLQASLTDLKRVFHFAQPVSICLMVLWFAICVVNAIHILFLRRLTSGSS